MRIRKNAKLSSLSFSSSHASTPPPESLQTHLCQLNQSPWDVIPFSSSSQNYPLNHQFEREDNSLTGNGSFDDSIGAIDSAGSITFNVEDIVIVENGIEEEGKVIDFDNNDDEFCFKNKSEQPYCVKTDGKSWHCRNVATFGYNLCEHHLLLLKSYGNGNASATKMPSVPGNRKGRAANKGLLSTLNKNPYDFYYYSGFGPLWAGKRRGENASDVKKEVEIISRNDDNCTNKSKAPSSNSSLIDSEEFGYVVDEFDDDDDDDQDDEVIIGNANSRKKRMRKPVKARSLKSLM